MRKLIIVIIALIAFSGFLSAQFYTGNTLLAELEKGDLPDATMEEKWDSIVAWGYIIGVFDSFGGIDYASHEGITKG